MRLGIVGTGSMGASHAKHFAAVPGCRVVAGVDVEAGRAEAFCREHGIARWFTRVEDMLAGEEVDAVSVVTPDRFHAPVAIACLQAGKAVLCEKPLATNYREARRMVAAAKAAGSVNMVNFSYRDWGVLHAVAEEVRKGRLGEIRHVEASYFQSWLAANYWGDWREGGGRWLWRLARSAGSLGVLGDIGVHILDFASYPVGPVREVQCRLQTFKKTPGNRMGGLKLDANDSAVVTVSFAQGALGVVQVSRWATGHQNRLFLKIHGTEGALEFDSERGVDTFRVCAGKAIHRAEWTERKARPVANNYRRFVEAVRKGQPAEPGFARGAEIQRVLDACFRSAETGQAVRVGT